ncbi:hypothetical protein [Salinithrix halophila]|uniref:YtpI-like protein n=1 Tax=Salinithrix halophila TaxID=1485204 RepID=A0ABV8JB37_9BACL
MEPFLIFLVIVILYTAVRTFSLSMASRRSDGLTRQRHQAWMNIHMGIMFIAVSLMQGLSLAGNWMRLLLLLLIAAIGLFNLFAGWSNLLRVRQAEERLKKDGSPAKEAEKDPGEK